MRNGFLGAALVAALLALTAPAAQAAPVVVGIGDQKADMFSDPRLPWLGIKDARLVVSWHVETAAGDPAEKQHVAKWMAAARRAGVRPLVSFGHAFTGPTRNQLVSVKRFRAAFAAFRKKYPWVRAYVPWNEANHCSQPTCKKAARAAQYFDAVKSACRGCTVLAPTVVDQPNMVKWLKELDRRAKHPVTVLGLHNYLDANRLRTSGTDRLLKAFPKAKVWLVETGGLVFRKPYRNQIPMPSGTDHAGRATKFVLDTAAKQSRRVQRVYLYHWNVDRPEPTWDSGLIDWAGVARPGFLVLARFLGRNPALAPLPKITVPPLVPPPPAPGTSEPPPAATNQPPAGTQGSSEPSPSPQPQPQPQPQPAPPPPPCTIPVVCPILG